MTEDEAKTKWCPFALVARTNYAANRRMGGGASSFAQCIGSECMAWRWGERLESEREAYMRGTDLRRTLQSNTDGYCGLAGKP